MNLIYLPIIILTILTLVYVSYQDIKYREINIVYLIILAILSILYFSIFIFKFDWNLWKDYLIQTGIVFVFILIIYGLGRLTKLAYIGEGDLYTILALGFTNIYSSLFVIFVFLFALLFMLGTPILLFFYNKFKGNYPDYSLFTSIFLMFLGTPKRISNLNEFNTPLEKISYKNNRIIKVAQFSPNFDPLSEINRLKVFSQKHNIKYVWVSPLLPFVLLILFSYIFVVVILFIIKFPSVFQLFSIFF
jgi:hypothetical protein